MNNQLLVSNYDKKQVTLDATMMKCMPQPQNVTY